MTLLEQQTYVLRALQDTAGTYWTAELVKALLNQGYLDMGTRTAALKKYVTFVRELTGESPNLYVPDYQYTLDEVLFLQVGESPVPLCRTTIEGLAARDGRWLDTTTTYPTEYVPNDYTQGAVFVYPQPTATLTTLTGLITYVHPTLTGDGEAPLFPAAYHVLACFYALAECYAVDQENESPAKEAYWRARYEKGLATYAAKVQRSHARGPRLQPGGYV